MTEAGRTRRTVSWFIAAALLLLVVFGLSLSLGAVNIALDEIVGWVAGGLTDDSLAGRVLSGVRLPRALAAVAIGAALGVAGTTLQGIHRTGVVDAQLIGVSSAAGLGVAIAYAVAPSEAGVVWAVIVGAAGGATYGLASRRFGVSGRGSTILVLVGIAAGLALMAWTGLFVLMVDSASVPTVSFFIFGSLSGASWQGLAYGVPLIVAGAAVVWWMGPGLDLLALGEQASRHLGFNTRRNTAIALAALGVAVGASVALGGVIAFVGLIVPLFVRPMVGSTHRLMIPASAMIGAIAVLAFDTAARVLASPVEIPIGLLTAAIGGPILVVLVRREVHS